MGLGVGVGAVGSALTGLIFDLPDRASASAPECGMLDFGSLPSICDFF